MLRTKITEVSGTGYYEDVVIEAKIHILDRRDYKVTVKTSNCDDNRFRINGFLVNHLANKVLEIKIKDNYFETTINRYYPEIHLEKFLFYFKLEPISKKTLNSVVQKQVQVLKLLRNKIDDEIDKIDVN